MADFTSFTTSTSRNSVHEHTRVTTCRRRSCSRRSARTRVGEAIALKQVLDVRVVVVLEMRKHTSRECGPS